MLRDVRMQVQFLWDFMLMRKESCLLELVLEASTPSPQHDKTTSHAALPKLIFLEILQRLLANMTYKMNEETCSICSFQFIPLSIPLASPFSSSIPQRQSSPPLTIAPRDKALLRPLPTSSKGQRKNRWSHGGKQRIHITRKLVSTGLRRFRELVVHKFTKTYDWFSAWIHIDGFILLAFPLSEWAFAAMSSNPKEGPLHLAAKITSSHCRAFPVALTCGSPKRPWPPPTVLFLLKILPSHLRNANSLTLLVSMVKYKPGSGVPNYG